MGSMRSRVIGVQSKEIGTVNAWPNGGSGGTICFALWKIDGGVKLGALVKSYRIPRVQVILFQGNKPVPDDLVSKEPFLRQVTLTAIAWLLVPSSEMSGSNYAGF